MNKKNTTLFVKNAMIFGSLFVSSLALAQTGEVSFTPTGIKFPIMKITISKNTGSSGTATSAENEQTLYKCSSTTEADCLINLADQTDLDTIAAAASSVAITEGTYNQISLYSCADGKSGTDHVSIWLKGSFTASSTNYYTDSTAASGIASSGGGTASFTEISNWGCATKSIILASSITVGSGTPLTLTVLVDNTFLANSIPITSSGMGGCKASGGGRGVCVNIPALLPYVGTDTTTTKRFKLSHHISSAGSIVDNKANAVVIVPMAGTTPLTVFAGPYYSETSAAASSNTSAPTDATYGGPTYNTSTDVASFGVNTDSTIKFSQGASEDTHAGKFTAFQLTDHSATLIDRGGTTWYYKAISF